MEKKTLLEHFGNPTKAAKALGISRQGIYLWGDLVPELVAYKAQGITGGALTVDPATYEKTPEGG